MLHHKIYVKRRRQEIGKAFNIPLVRRCVRVALDAEGVDVSCEVSVLITDNKGIRSINKEFRNIDEPTDVLSFPMQYLTPGKFKANPQDINPETGLLPLGDVILSADRVYEQAQEYGHSDMREASYLIVHSILHLLGYDHMDEGEQKRLMRTREETILDALGYGRY